VVQVLVNLPNHVFHLHNASTTAAAAAARARAREYLELLHLVPQRLQRDVQVSGRNFAWARRA
jgi:hypothetical protein